MILGTVTRFCYGPKGTYGKLSIENFDCFTVERPWLNNKVRESCIPEGLYKCKLGRYNKGGYTAYEVQDVPGRSLIKIHIANYPRDVMGCIGLGTTYSGNLVGSSKSAYMEFMDHMRGIEEFELAILQIVGANL